MSILVRLRESGRPPGLRRRPPARLELYGLEDRIAPVTELVSTGPLGAPGNGESLPGLSAVSADGRFVVFQSLASDLVPGDTNGVEDVFVRDMKSGTTTRVSVDSFRNQGNGASRSPTISSDGRFVAFHSWASNLVEGDTNGVGDVFVHDRQTRTTTRVSVHSDGTQGNDHSTLYNPSVSADGRFVAFASSASNLASGPLVPDTNGVGDVFVHDRQTRTTTRVSVHSDATQADAASSHPHISGDGRVVAFASLAGNLVDGDTNGVEDVFVHDRQTGTTTRVSVHSDATQGNNFSYGGTLSADGRYVAFDSWASNLVDGDTNGVRDVFVHDRQTAATWRVNLRASGRPAGSHSGFPSLSGDGKFVTFWSLSSLVPADVNGVPDVYRVNVVSTVHATLSSTGRLTLTGDRGNNHVTLKLDEPGVGTTITGNAGTLIVVNGALHPSFTFTQPVRSLMADLTDGNDTLAIDGTADFVLNGPATIDLGNGNNVLNLVTSGTLTINGNLTVRAGTGADSVTVGGRPGSSVGGGVSVRPGAGRGDLLLESLTVRGPAGVSVLAGDGDDAVTLRGVTVETGRLAVTGGAGTTTVGLVPDGAAVPTTTRRMVMVSGTGAVAVTSTGATAGGGMTISGGRAALTELIVNGPTASAVNGALHVRGTDTRLTATGGGLTVAGNLSLAASRLTEANLATTGVGSTHVYHLSVSGGAGNAVVTATASLRVDRNLTLNLRGGGSTVALGSAGQVLAVGGNLTILGNAGEETVTLTGVQVSGATRLRLGAGKDTVTVTDGSQFTGPTQIDLGAGGDRLAIAIDPAAVAGVLFGGRTTLLTGTGDDEARIGNAAGGANTTVTFAGMGNVLNLGRRDADTFSLPDWQVAGPAGAFRVLDDALMITLP